MSELKNDRYLKALLREPVDMTPVWTVSYTHLHNITATIFFTKSK